MPWTIARDVEEALWAAARETLAPWALQGKTLHAAIVERSLRYTSERERLRDPVPARALDSDLAARALFFTVADAAKVMIPLAELDRCDRLVHQDGRPLRILDLGAGCGAMTLGTLDYLQRRGQPVVVHAIDRDAAALDILAGAVRELASRWRMDVDVQTTAGDVSASIHRSFDRSFDLVLAGGLLNELAPAARLPAVREMIAAIAPGGAVVVVEPALRETARDLHELRDRVLEQGLARVFAPCTRQIAPCPMLADESDWCHEDRPTRLPERAGKLASVTGLRGHGLKFAYLVLRREPAGQLPADEGDSTRATVRVVSQLRKSKGKRECWVCGDDGRVEVRLLSRHRSPHNRRFDRIARGDALVVDPKLAAGGDVGEDDAITVAKLAPPRAT